LRLCHVLIQAALTSAAPTTKAFTAGMPPPSEASVAYAATSTTPTTSMEPSGYESAA
jgi:hypothetical protein